MYTLLLPYAKLYAEAPLEGTFGAVARGLGVAATTLGRFDDAEDHFEAALEIELRMGGRPWHAHAQHGLAAMLLTRAEAGDAERAGALLSEPPPPTWSSGWTPGPTGQDMHPPSKESHESRMWSARPEARTS